LKFGTKCSISICFLVQGVDYNLISLKLDDFFHRGGLDTEVVKKKQSSATSFVNFALDEISGNQRLSMIGKLKPCLEFIFNADLSSKTAIATCHILLTFFFRKL
jgi:hypothetical protein